MWPLVSFSVTRSPLMLHSFRAELRQPNILRVPGIRTSASASRCHEGQDSGSGFALTNVRRQFVYRSRTLYSRPGASRKCAHGLRPRFRRTD